MNSSTALSGSKNVVLLNEIIKTYKPTRLSTMEHDVRGAPSNLHVQEQVDWRHVVSNLSSLEHFFALRQ